MVMTELTMRVAAMVIPKVPFWIPDSMAMVRLCWKFNPAIFARPYPKPNVAKLSAKEAGPASTKNCKRLSFSFTIAAMMMITKNIAEIFRKGASHRLASSGAFFNTNIPIATGMIVIAKTATTVPKISNFNSSPPGIK